MPVRRRPADICAMYDATDLDEPHDLNRFRVRAFAAVAVGRPPSSAQVGDATAPHPADGASQPALNRIDEFDDSGRDDDTAGDQTGGSDQQRSRRVVTSEFSRGS